MSGCDERNMARPRERWSETLIRRAEEAMLVSRISRGLVLLRVIGFVVLRRWRNRYQKKSRRSQKKMKKQKSLQKLAQALKRLLMDSRLATEYRMMKNRTTLPPEEMQDVMDQFASIVQHKFLSGEDGQHLDYTKMDNDETLDDHWLGEIGLDAEEK